VEQAPLKQIEVQFFLDPTPIKNVSVIPSVRSEYIRQVSFAACSSQMCIERGENTVQMQQMNPISVLHDPLVEIMRYLDPSGA
jgi:hypothetical protein